MNKPKKKQTHNISMIYLNSVQDLYFVKTIDEPFLFVNCFTETLIKTTVQIKYVNQHDFIGGKRHHEQTS